ncbi:hypothetical protein BK010_08885 [Tenericutes bacterium MO-XQ]|nr:hypothetical protein BK010_08375 [Tenericutes bacterium MO-XQ]AUD63697.1 hypothetical protein BK010_08885 [Tenericutes bacterium MO-XQ]
MKVKIAEIRSIDSKMCEAMKMYGARVYAIHNATIHLSLKDEHILTLGSNISEGYHHIVIDEDINFKKLDVNIGNLVTWDDGFFNIGIYQFTIQEQNIKIYEPEKTTFNMEDNHYQKTLQYVDQWFPKGISLNEKDDSITNVFMIDKYKKFEMSPSYKTALDILGLGYGLTPLGDDILVGYILSKNARNIHVSWIKQIINKSKTKTNWFSRQNLTDTYNKVYPKLYIDFIEEFFTSNNTVSLNKVISVGSTSGYGILYGFLIGLKEGDTNEKV